MALAFAEVTANKSTQCVSQTTHNQQKHQQSKKAKTDGTKRL